MASDKKKRSSGKVVETEDVQQAVVIADSFNVRFSPLTTEKPRVLLPLVNCPLIDYTLECLKSSHIQEVVLFCSSHGDQIKEYINSSLRWSSPSSPMQISVIVSDTCFTLGDALREIDSKGVIRGDFVLCYGDLVSNVKLMSVIEKHKEIKKVDRGAVMTMVYKVASPEHSTQSTEDSLVIAANPDTNRMYHLQKLGKRGKLELPMEVIEENPCLSIRHDLLDSQLCICSSIVPLLFADNFDYQTVDDFVRGILVNEEILGNSIYMHTLDGEYAARASNFYMYGAISSDVLNRWVYPVTPDLATANGVKYSHLRHNVYIPKDVTLARGCSLEENVAVGHRTHVDTGTTIRNSVIGDSCKIGKNVTIDNSFLWGNVTVEDGATITYAILADDVVVKKGVTISPGCVLSYNVVVGPDVVIAPGKLLTAESQDDASVDTVAFGAAARAFPCAACEEQEDSDEEEHVEQELWRLPVTPDVTDDDSSNLDESCDENLADSPIPDDVNLFYKEVLDSLQRGVEEKIKCENLVLEVNSSKYAYNVTMREVNMKVMAAILELPHLEKELSAQELLTKQLPLLTQLLPLIKNYIKNLESQLDCLCALEEYCFNRPATTQILSKIVSVLYDKDVLSEEAVLRWFKQPNDDNLEEHKEVRDKVYPFIKWLQEAEEESSSEDS